MVTTVHKEFAITWICDPDRCSPPDAPEQEGVICALDKDEGGGDSIYTIAVKFKHKDRMRWGWARCDDNRGAIRLWHYLYKRQNKGQLGPIDSSGEYGKILLNFYSDDTGGDIAIRGVTFVEQEPKVILRSDPALYNHFKGFGMF